jgi:hypothetical protein
VLQPPSRRLPSRLPVRQVQLHSNLLERCVKEPTLLSSFSLASVLSISPHHTGTLYCAPGNGGRAGSLVA